MAEVKSPTVELGRLYEGKGDAKLLGDFVQAQQLLSDPDRALPYLKQLNDALVKVQPGPLQGKTAADQAIEADQLLDQVLGEYEEKCGFKSERPLLVGFASGDDFRVLTGEGRHFYDVGAGLTHGEMTHRIQWFIVMAAVTGGTFENVAAGDYTNTPLRLFAASLNEEYEVASNSPSKTSYMWDWIVDRNRGIYPDGADGMDYDPARDAWTNPGDAGGPGPLSNDIRGGKLPGIDKLKELRSAQVAGNKDYNSQLETWFNLATDLNAAEGHGLKFDETKKTYVVDPDLPTYFYLPSPKMLDVLRGQQKVVADLTAAVRTWAKTAKASDPQTSDLLKRVANAQGSAIDLLAPVLPTGTKQKLAPAILDSWFSPLVTKLAVANMAEGSGFPTARDDVLKACDDVEKSPATKLL